MVDTYRNIVGGALLGVGAKAGVKAAGVGTRKIFGDLELGETITEVLEALIGSAGVYVVRRQPWRAFFGGLGISGIVQLTDDLIEEGVKRAKKPAAPAPTPTPTAARSPADRVRAALRGGR
jgi:hypothetical protein